MKLVVAKCPNCNAALNIESNSSIVKCEYCNANIMIEEDKLKVQKTNMEEEKK